MTPTILKSKNRLAVIAVGGNSLIDDREAVTVASEYRIVGRTCRQIARLIADRWQVVITHGNGPQAGFNLRRCELAAHEVFELPIDVIVTFTQGSIGYYIQQNLYNQFKQDGVAKEVVTVITQVEVDPRDSAFGRPAKPIGAYMDRKKAAQLETTGWTLAEAPGKGWRRLIASPQPRRIPEQAVIGQLLAQGHVVIACGGGGVAVVPDDQGRLRGVDAIVDKDLTSALLAAGLQAELLIICTAVSRVALNFDKPQQIELDSLDARQARQYQDQGHFAPGSMGPKIQAALNFLDRGGKRVIITSPDDICQAVEGRAGTHIVP